MAVYHGMFCEALLSPVRDDIAEQISGWLANLGTMPILATELARKNRVYINKKKQMASEWGIEIREV